MPEDAAPVDKLITEVPKKSPIPPPPAKSNEGLVGLTASPNEPDVSQVYDHRPDVYSANDAPPAAVVPDVAGNDLVEIKAVFVPMFRYNGQAGSLELLAKDTYEAAQAAVEQEMRTDSGIGSGTVEKRYVRS